MTLRHVHKTLRHGRTKCNIASIESETPLLADLIITSISLDRVPNSDYKSPSWWTRRSSSSSRLRHPFLKQNETVTV